MYVDCVCTLFCLQIVVDSMSACEDGDEYARKVISVMNHGIIMKRVMIILGRNKSKNNMVDSRQAIHPCIPTLPMFYYMTCFRNSYYYVSYILVASFGFS